MRGALALVAAEMRAHRLALWAGLAWGTTITLVGMLLGGNGDGDVPFLFTVMAIQIAVSIAVGLGASIVSRDLRERRLGFYLARPLPSLAYWAAKMSAALLLALAAAALSLVPALVLAKLGLLDTGDLSLSTVARAASSSYRPYVVLTFFLAAAAAAGGALRSRSRLLILDLVMLLLTVTLFFRAVGGTVRLGTSDIVIPHVLTSLFAVATVVLLGAGAAQICRGRLDFTRGHLWLSTITWGGLLGCIGAIVLMSRSVASATPGDLWLPHGVSLHAPQAGERVMLEGRSIGWYGVSAGPLGGPFYPGFLLDAQGRFVRMGGLEGLTGFTWSADGRHFAWSRDSIFGGASGGYSGPGPLRDSFGFQPSLWIASLAESGGAPRQLPRAEGERVRALSPSGQRLLVSARRSKALVGVASGETLAVLAEPADWANARFLSETLVRALRVSPSAHSRIVEWDSASGRLTEKGAIALEGGRAWYSSLVPTDDFERVLRFDASGLYVHDLEGRVVATLVDGWPTRANRAAGLVSGGRVASIEEQPEGLRLRVFDLEGRRRADTLLKGRYPLRVGGEIAPGVLALGVAPAGTDTRRETLFVDLADGSVVRRETGLQPALRRWVAPQGLGPQSAGRGEAALPDESHNPAPGSLGTRLFLGDEGLVLLDGAGAPSKLIVRRRDRLED